MALALGYLFASAQHGPPSQAGVTALASAGAQQTGQFGQWSQQPGGQQGSQHATAACGASLPPSVVNAPTPARHTPRQAEPIMITKRMGVSSNGKTVLPTR
jgi:hypothetical protein